MLRRRVPLSVLALVGLEAVAIVAVIALVAWIRLGEQAPSLLNDELFFAQAMLVAFVCQGSLYFLDLYDLRVTSGKGSELAVRAAQAVGVASIVAAAIYSFRPELRMGSGIFIPAALAVGVFALGWRFAFDALGARETRRERLLVVGTNPGSIELARELHERRELGTHVVGFIETGSDQDRQPETRANILGTIDDIPQVAAEHKVDRIVVSLIEARGTLPVGKLLDMKLQGVKFDHLASVYEEHTGKIAVGNFRLSWLLFNSGFQKTATRVALKRAIDVFAGAVGLVLLSPVILLIAAGIKLTSPGPALYHQSRVGQNGRVFVVHKLRSMSVDAEAATGAVWASGSDSRVTALGTFLRRTRLDELPQLWNVLCGEMSLVGPRPERPEFVSSLAEQIPLYGQRHAVKPGVTGWAQVSYTYGASVEDALEKLKYDLFYIKNVSVAFDVFIILKTIKTVIMQRGAR